MSEHEAREQRLAAIERWAKEIPTTLAVLHERHGHHVHLRPTTSGVTLVGLTPDRPQRGQGGIRNMQRLLDDFGRLFDNHCVPTSQGRETSEKAVQSAMILDVYEHGRSIRIIETATAATNDPVAPIFVADELCLPRASGEICCDLFGLRRVATGIYRPVVIELKWKRQMKRLVKQVTDFADLVEEHRASFEAVSSALLARPIQLLQQCERWVVWPPLSDCSSESRVGAFAAHRIRVFTYWWVGKNLQLRAWPAPISG